MNREREEISEDPFTAYCRDVFRYPSRLNYEQEQIAFGYLRDARSIQDLAGSDRFRAAVKPGEENKFQQAFAGSQDIKNLINLCNLRLVIYFASRYVTSGVEISDLVGEGNIGLIRAIDKFDYTRETSEGSGKRMRFSTYAVYWIKQACGRCQEGQSTTIRVSAHVRQNERYMQRFFEEFTVQNKRPPTEMELKESFVKKVPAAVASTAETAYQVWQSNSAKPVSLDRAFYPNDPDGEETLADHVFKKGDDPGELATRIVYNQELRTRLGASLERLDPRERRIIELLYLTDPSPESLSEIGNKMDRRLNREGVRQLRNEALHQLSQDKDLRALYAELLS